MFSFRPYWLVVVALLATAGCSAQSPSAPPELARTIENQMRVSFNLPPSVEITVGEIKPSDIPGYDTVKITLKNKERQTNYDFLISKDRSTLARLDKIDLTKDPAKSLDIAGRPVRGNKDAKVTIVNFDDFQCPFCARMHQSLFPGLMKTYGDQVKVVYKDYPLEGIHPWAVHAAVDANCLAVQNPDAYWEYADYVHDHLAEINGEKHVLADSKKRLDDLSLELGKKHSLDGGKLQACVQKQDETTVRESMKQGDALGIDSTPTLFINGERVAGAYPTEIFEQVLDRALRDAGLPVPEHTQKPEDAANRQQAAPGAASPAAPKK